MPITLLIWTRSRAIPPATAVQAAVSRHASECRCACRQAKRLTWPAARAWHALTGWPQADVDRPTAPALLQALLSTVLQAAGGTLVASVGCVYGWLAGRASPRLSRSTGEALGEVLATPLHALIDLLGMGGAAVLSLTALALDTVGAALGTLVGLLWGPWVAYQATAGAPG